MSTFTGFFGGDSAELIDEQIFTSSGNWNKPAKVQPTDLIMAQLWAGGAAGSRQALGYGNYEVNIGGHGGWPGSYVFFHARAIEIADTELVTIGSGGLPHTNNLPNSGGATESEVSVAGNGGNTSFAGVTAWGGIGATVVTYLMGVRQGMGPSMGAVPFQAFGRMLRSNSTDTFLQLPRANIFIDRGEPHMGFAGGRGGSIASKALPGEKPPHGGEGGAARLGMNGDPGKAPGGGGGAALAGYIAGAGARGEARIRIFRGV